MGRPVAQILEEIQAVDLSSDDYLLRLNDLCKEIATAEDRASAIQPILRFMEQHPDEDFGAPGPFVHLLEKLPGYEPELLNSLRRVPTALTVWMLNRIINVSTGDARARLLALMREISGNASADAGARDAATDLLRYQENG
jgi:hypothetical protein